MSPLASNDLVKGEKEGEGGFVQGKVPGLRASFGIRSVGLSYNDVGAHGFCTDLESILLFTCGVA